ncbi:unnamed protein product [Dicrocoelium dendriticum]|nr:unnamed protein product [Dicrocoelium dendriticum]
MDVTTPQHQALFSFSKDQVEEEDADSLGQSSLPVGVNESLFNLMDSLTQAQGSFLPKSVYSLHNILESSCIRGSSLFYPGCSMSPLKLSVYQVAEVARRISQLYKQVVEIKLDDPDSEIQTLESGCAKDDTTSSSPVSDATQLNRLETIGISRIARPKSDLGNITSSSVAPTGLCKLTPPACQSSMVSGEVSKPAPNMADTFRTPCSASLAATKANATGQLNSAVSHLQLGITGNQTSNWPKLGVPLPAAPTRVTAPVHVDVGGVLYTSSLQTLTKYPDSRLGRMFSGVTPIILDTMKQHYFIDRDGTLFRHVLNFLRTGQVNIGAQFDEFDQLVQEVRHYELGEMLEALDRLASERRSDGRKRVIRNKLQSRLSLNKKRRIQHCQVAEEFMTKENDGARTCALRFADSEMLEFRIASSNYECMWVEMNVSSPFSGIIQLAGMTSVQGEQWARRIGRFVGEKCQCSDNDSREHMSLEGSTQVRWHDMARADQLTLWQFILADGFEILAQHSPLLTKSGCYTYLLGRKSR